MGLGLVAKISEHEAFRPVSRIRIVIIVAMTCILIVGIFASLVLAKVGCCNLELVFQRTLGFCCRGTACMVLDFHNGRLSFVVLYYHTVRFLDFHLCCLSVCLCLGCF